MNEKGEEITLDFITESNNRLWGCSILARWEILKIGIAS